MKDLPPLIACVYNTTSIEGLEELKRRFPRRHFDLLRSRRHPPRSFFFEDVLRSGMVEMLFPQHPDDQRFREFRTAAARLLPVLRRADVRVVTGRVLRRYAKRYIEARSDLSRSRMKKDLSILRRLMREAQNVTLGCTLVPARWRYGRLPPAPPRPQDLLSLDDLRRLLAAAGAQRGGRGIEIQVAVVLALAVRATPSEIARIRIDHLDLDRAEIHIPVGNRRGRPGQVCARTGALPPWAMCFVRELVSARSDERGYLFPHAGDATRHQTTLSSRLSKLSRRILGHPLGLSDVRALGQAIARAHGSARATVRGAVLDDMRQSPSARRAFEREQRQLARRWSLLLEPPAQPGRLPSRAPSGCPPTQSELASARRRATRFSHSVSGEALRALPASCGGAPRATPHAERHPTRVSSAARDAAAPNLPADAPRSAREAPHSTLADARPLTAPQRAELVRLRRDLERLESAIPVAMLAGAGLGWLVRDWVESHDGAVSIPVEALLPRLDAALRGGK